MQVAFTFSAFNKLYKYLFIQVFINFTSIYVPSYSDSSKCYGYGYQTYSDVRIKTITNIVKCVLNVLIDDTHCFVIVCVICINNFFKEIFSNAHNNIHSCRQQINSETLESLSKNSSGRNKK